MLTTGPLTPSLHQSVGLVAPSTLCFPALPRVGWLHGFSFGSAADTEMLDVPVECDTPAAGSTIDSLVTPPSSAASTAPSGAGSGSVAAMPGVDTRPTHERGPGPFGEVVPLLNQKWPYPHPRPCLATTRWASLEPRRMAKVWRIFRLFYPDLFKVPLGEATDYPLPRYAEE